MVNLLYIHVIDQHTILYHNCQNPLHLFMLLLYSVLANWLKWVAATDAYKFNLLPTISPPLHLF